MNQIRLDTPPIEALPPPGLSAADPVIAAVSGRQSAWLSLAAQLLKFGTVGGLGFLWDAATVYGLRPLIGLKAATIGAYLVAATMNWLLNRVWTFRGAGGGGRFRQWLAFLVANMPGFAINRCVVFALFWLSPIFVDAPILALAPGSLAGMIANFGLSRRLVFRAGRG